MGGSEIVLKGVHSDVKPNSNPTQSNVVRKTDKGQIIGNNQNILKKDAFEIKPLSRKNISSLIESAISSNELLVESHQTVLGSIGTDSLDKQKRENTKQLFDLQKKLNNEEISPEEAFQALKVFNKQDSIKGQVALEQDIETQTKIQDSTPLERVHQAAIGAGSTFLETGKALLVDLPNHVSKSMPTTIATKGIAGTITGQGLKGFQAGFDEFTQSWAQTGQTTTAFAKTAYNLTPFGATVNAYNQYSQTVKDLGKLKKEGRLTPETAQAANLKNFQKNESVQSIIGLVDGVTNIPSVIRSGGDPREIGKATANLADLALGSGLVGEAATALPKVTKTEGANNIVRFHRPLEEPALVSVGGKNKTPSPNTAEVGAKAKTFENNTLGINNNKNTQVSPNSSSGGGEGFHIGDGKPKDNIEAKQGNSDFQVPKAGAKDGIYTPTSSEVKGKLKFLGKPEKVKNMTFREVHKEKGIYSAADTRDLKEIIKERKQGLPGDQLEGVVSEIILEMDGAELTGIGTQFYRKHDSAGNFYVRPSNKIYYQGMGDKDVSGITQSGKTFFIECGAGTAQGKTTQLPKYTNPQHPDFFNYSRDTVIFYVPDLSKRSLTGYLRDFGDNLIVAQTPEQLKSIIGILNKEPTLSPREINKRIGHPNPLADL